MSGDYTQRTGKALALNLTEKGLQIFMRRI